MSALDRINTKVIMVFWFSLQELYRKVRSILNKLTPQKFQTLTQQIIDLDIDTADRLEGAIDLIFEKVGVKGTKLSFLST